LQAVAGTTDLGSGIRRVSFMDLSFCPGPWAELFNAIERTVWIGSVETGGGIVTGGGRGGTCYGGFAEAASGSSGIFGTQLAPLSWYNIAESKLRRV